MAIVVIVGGIDPFRWDRCFAAVRLLCALFPASTFSNWPVPAVISPRRLLCGVALGARQRPADRVPAAARLHHHADYADYLTGRPTTFCCSTIPIRSPPAFPDIPSWNFPGRRRGVVGVPSVVLVYIVVARVSDMSSSRVLRPGMACHPRSAASRRLGLQFRHSGAANDRRLCYTPRAALLTRDRWRCFFCRTASATVGRRTVGRRASK